LDPFKGVRSVLFGVEFSQSFLSSGLPLSLGDLFPFFVAVLLKLCVGLGLVRLKVCLLVPEVIKPFGSRVFVVGFFGFLHCLALR
jgi:hypothetical protein